jgi:transposase
MSVAPRDARNAELEKEIEKLKATIEEQGRIIEEQGRIIEEQSRIIEEWKRGHRTRSRPNPRKKRKGGQKKKAGRAKGHEGAQRKIPDKIDVEVERTKDACDKCSGALIPTGNTEEVIIENVIPARVEVEKNILFEYLCAGCGKIHWSELPPEYGDKPLPGTSKLGPGALEMALDLRYDMRLSFHNIAKYFNEHVGLKITVSGIYQLIERTARRTQGVSEEILERALMSAYLNMDETTWWQDGEKLWAWLMANLDLSYFHFDKSRGHQVIEKLLCELDEDGKVIAPYEGTIVSDFMGAYRTCEWMVHQFCWVHLLRDANKALEMAPDERIQEFTDRLHEIYFDALIAQSTGDESKQRGIRIRLGRLVADAELGGHPDVARLQGRAHQEFHGLLHFMSDPELPAHNNNGELAARALVMMRKVIGGTRSERGTEVHAHFMSTSQTAHKQGIDHGDFIIQALAAYYSGEPLPTIFDS